MASKRSRARPMRAERTCPSCEREIYVSLIDPKTGICPTCLLHGEYKKLFPHAEALCEELKRQIGTILEGAGVTPSFPIEGRVKQWESLRGKLERLPHIKKIRDVHDLVGLRIILLFDRDVARVSSLISEQLDVIRHSDKRKTSEPDQFGYSSDHFVVSVPHTWLSVPTLRHMRNWEFEIQVRTLAQHMWAEVSHKLQYKQEGNVSLATRRAIHRVSALLEVADLEFERALDKRDSYRESNDLLVTDEQLNVDLLEKILNSLLPLVNKSFLHEQYSELLNNLALNGITTQQQLTKLIQMHRDEVLAEDLRLVEEYLPGLEALSDEELSSSIEGSRLGGIRERLRDGVFFSHTQLIERMLTKSYHIISQLSDDKCLDVYGSNVDDETNIQLFTLHRKPNQQWKLIPAEGEYYYIVSGLSNGECLDVYGSNTSDGTNIQLFTLHRKPNQQWKLMPTGDYYYIVSRLSDDKCLDVYGSNTDPDDETNIQLNTLRLGEPSQQWKLMPTGE